MSPKKASDLADSPSIRVLDPSRCHLGEGPSYDPATEAVSAHVYIPSREHEPLPPFDGQHFRLLFHALFAPARNPTPGQRAIIEERLGMTPEQAFGRFLGALDDN